MNEKKALTALKNVLDPELGISVVDLGLIYDIKVVKNKAKVKMTLTSPTCPLSGMIVAGVEDAIRSTGLQPEVKIVFKPAWSLERMSPKAKKMLGFKG